MIGVARVLITGFCAVPAPRRSGVQLRHVVRALAPDHAVDLLVVREGDQGYVERQGGVRILRVPTHDDAVSAQIQTFQRALRRQLEGADYDIVHCRDPWAAVPVLEARDRLGYAVVYDLARALDVDPGGLEPALDAIRQRDEDACLAAADLVLVPTEPARRHVAGRARSEHVAVAPPGVDVDRFDWDDPPPGPPRIVYAGAVEPGRGIRVLLRAMADVAAQSDARLALVGPVAGGFAPVVESGIADLGLADRVDVVGAVDHDEIPGLLATAAICVAPAAAELTARPTSIYPTKILEYMACRRAVVAARRSTVGMLIDHGRDGLLFQPGDPGDLTRKLLRLLGDRDLRERLAGAGYERVRREHTASAARRTLRAAYAGLVARRPSVRADSADERRHTTGTGESASDDDFEATVFEELPAAAGRDSLSAMDSVDGVVDAPSLDGALDSSLQSLDGVLAALDGARAGDSPHTEDRVVAPPPPREGDDTLLRLGRAAGRRGWRAPGDDWVVASLHDVTRTPSSSSRVSLRSRADSEDDGTPLDVHLLPPLPPELPAFASGEIDVPRDRDGGGFTAASPLLGPPPLDDDTMD
jgi:glycosyltransferase involved in cell wall biosynthesis